jgi:hypothetical protein
LTIKASHFFFFTAKEQIQHFFVKYTHPTLQFTDKFYHLKFQSKIRKSEDPVTTVTFANTDTRAQIISKIASAVRVPERPRPLFWNSSATEELCWTRVEELKMDFSRADFMIVGRFPDGIM